MTDPIQLELEFIPSCPICKSERIQPVINANWKGLDITYGVCHDCGQMFLNPRMTDEQTTIYYSGQYRDITEGVPSGVSQANQYNQYKRASLQKQLLDGYLGEIQSHLELGCSAGYWLDEIKAPDSMGVEPDIRYHELPIARLYPMATALEIVPHKPYQLISMSHVLEHFNHPLEMITELVTHYSGDDTRFMIEVPNSEYQVVATVSHPMAFNVNNLCRLFARVGYEAITIQYHGLGGAFPQYLLALFGKAKEERK